MDFDQKNEMQQAPIRLETNRSLPTKRINRVKLEWAWKSVKMCEGLPDPYQFFHRYLPIRYGRGWSFIGTRLDLESVPLPKAHLHYMFIQDMR